MRRETVPFIIKFSPRAPTKPSTRKPTRLTTSLIAPMYLGDAVDVADIAVILVVGDVEGRQVARCRNVATRGGGSAAYRLRARGSAKETPCFQLIS
jgi:hypothetical protein